MELEASPCFHERCFLDFLPPFAVEKCVNLFTHGNASHRVVLGISHPSGVKPFWEGCDDGMDVMSL